MKFLIGCASIAALILSGSLRADPIQVTYNGVTYDITTENLDSADASAQTLLEAQPWYGDYLGGEFDRLAYQAGPPLAQLPGSSEYGSPFGAYFVNYIADPDGTFDAYYIAYGSGNYQQLPFGGQTITYAIATEVPQGSVPDGGPTLALLGVAFIGLVLVRHGRILRTV